MGYQGYYLHRMTSFDKLFAGGLPSFGTIFGTNIFYSTPVLFAMLILSYLIFGINKNLKKINDFHQNIQSIEILLSTLRAKITVGMSDDGFKSEVVKLADILQNKKLQEMNLENKEDKPKRKHIGFKKRLMG